MNEIISFQEILLTDRPTLVITSSLAGGPNKELRNCPVEGQSALSTN